MKTAAIDFETFYSKDCTISELGVHGYCNHPDWEAYLVSIVTTEGLKYVGHPSKAPWEEIKDYLWISHNAAFDRYVFLTICLKSLKLEWGEAKARKGDWNCTANLSAYLGLGRSLAKAAKSLFNVAVSKDVRDQMKGKTSDQMTRIASSNPEQWKSFYEEVCTYALTDSEMCLKIWLEAQNQWPEHEKRLSLLSIKSGIRGIPINLSMIANSKSILQKESFEAANRLPWVKEGEKPLSRKSFFTACLKEGIPAPKSLAKEDVGFTEWNETYGEKITWARDRRIVNQAAIILPRLERMEDNSYRDDYGDRMAYSILYFGGHTGRWSGAEGFNIQNMNRETVCGVNVRGHIEIKSPRKLIISDLAQIEARVVPWLANDQNTLDLVRQGISVYEAHARVTMGWKYKGKKLKDEDPKLYLLAKTRVLALQFGCGWERFQLVAKKMLGMDLSESEAKQIVRAYRTSNPKITALWEQLDSGVKESARKNETFLIELPSGRTLKYYEPRMVKDPVARKEGVKARPGMEKGEQWLWGAFLAENLTQATARDAFAESLLRLEASGKYEVLFHVHDEVIVECGPEGKAKEVEEIMSVTPDWLPGCPIGAEATETQFYLK